MFFFVKLLELASKTVRGSVTELLPSEEGVGSPTHQVHEEGEYILAVDKVLDEYVDHITEPTTIKFDLNPVVYGLFSILVCDMVFFILRRFFKPTA